MIEINHIREDSHDYIIILATMTHEGEELVGVGIDRIDNPKPVALSRALHDLADKLAS